jgi:hypothetical protein
LTAGSGRLRGANNHGLAGADGYGRLFKSALGREEGLNGSRTAWNVT